MIFFDYNKIKESKEGNICVKCFFVNNLNVWICVSTKQLGLVKKFMLEHKQVKPINIKITDKMEKNNYYYLNYLIYDKIKDSKEGDIKVNCFYNGEKWMCVSSENLILSEQLFQWYNSTHNIKYVHVMVDQKMVEDITNYQN
jgi:hypothetical protein